MFKMKLLPVIAMSTTDIRETTVLILVFIFHLAAIIIGYKMQKTTLLISYLNAMLVISMFIYWVLKNLNIQEHNFELRESYALFTEACILIFALYSIMGFHNSTLKVINYIGFGIHLLVTIGMYIFISLFKINKLF